MQLIPIQPVPAQAVTCVLAGQVTQVTIRQKAYGLHVDVYLNGLLVIAGVLALNATRIVRSAYLGFVGDLAFFDNLGTEDPTYEGLGGRYSLLYLEASDLA